MENFININTYQNKQQFEKQLIDLGAKETSILSYEWKINTQNGELLVGLASADFTQTGKIKKNKKVFSIFTLFTNFEKCKHFLRRMSGQKFVFTTKWNFHNNDFNSNCIRFFEELKKIV
ncbi:MAG: hypothetical protein AABY22_06250 [Nanoarchaeota archaeon]